MNRAFVIGVGMSKFDKPGRKEGDYPDWVKEAAGAALADAGVEYGDVGQVYAGYAFGDTANGQRAVYEIGLTGVPIINVNNACATGSSALFLARQAVSGGSTDVALAFGFEKMRRGAIELPYTDRPAPVDRHLERMNELRPPEDTPMTVAMFGNAGRDHMERYGSTAEHFAWIGWKNHKHSVNNPYSQFQDEYSLAEIRDAPMIHAPLTKLQCSPTSDGAAAAVVANERYVAEHDLWDRAVEIAGQALTTDGPGTFDAGTNCIRLVGYDMARRAAAQVYEQAGVAPSDLDVIELHDCFSVNEVISYEALGLAPEGEGHRLVEREATTYGGDGPVVNPSGGLISKGHPIGATGLAQCAELTWQLRGDAGARQVDGAEIALQHNLGLGGACFISIYRRAQA